MTASRNTPRPFCTSSTYIASSVASTSLLGWSKARGAVAKAAAGRSPPGPRRAPGCVPLAPPLPPPSPLEPVAAAFAFEAPSAGGEREVGHAESAAGAVAVIGRAGLCGRDVDRLRLCRAEAARSSAACVVATIGCFTELAGRRRRRIGFVCSSYRRSTSAVTGSRFSVPAAAAAAAAVCCVIFFCGRGETTPPAAVSRSGKASCGGKEGDRPPPVLQALATGESMSGAAAFAFALFG